MVSRDRLLLCRYPRASLCERQNRLQNLLDALPQFLLQQLLGPMYNTRVFGLALEHKRQRFSSWRE